MTLPSSALSTPPPAASQPPPSPMTHRRRQIFLLKELVKRDFQGRYAGSLLSFFWSFIQPLFLLGLFTFVFAVVLRLKFEQYGVATENFGIFLFSGLLPWMAIQEGLQRGSTAITDSSALVKKMSFPSALLVLSIVCGALLHEAIAATVFAAILIGRGELAWRGLPWLALAIVLQIALTFGLALVLASVHVFFRDTSQMIGMVLTGWFYFTPIVYPLGMVPEGIRPWIEANPLTALVELYRLGFLGGRLEARLSLWVLIGSATALLAAGWWLFRRLEPAFVDEI